MGEFKNFLEQVSASPRHLREFPITKMKNFARGIGYCYTRTVWIGPTDFLLGRKARSYLAVLCDGLIQQMGGPETSGVGWASGIERIAMLLLWNLLQVQALHSQFFLPTIAVFPSVKKSLNSYDKKF